jgi:hypothetical protein
MMTRLPDGRRKRAWEQGSITALVLVVVTLVGVTVSGACACQANLDLAFDAAGCSSGYFGRIPKAGVVLHIGRCPLSGRPYRLRHTGPATQLGTHTWELDCPTCRLLGRIVGKEASFQRKTEYVACG